MIGELLRKAKVVGRVTGTVVYPMTPWLEKLYRGFVVGGVPVASGGEKNGVFWSRLTQSKKVEDFVTSLQLAGVVFKAGPPLRDRLKGNFNPHHDSKGRFTTGPGGGAGVKKRAPAPEASSREGVSFSFGGTMAEVDSDIKAEAERRGAAAKDDKEQKAARVWAREQQIDRELQQIGITRKDIEEGYSLSSDSEFQVSELQVTVRPPRQGLGRWVEVRGKINRKEGDTKDVGDFRRTLFMRDKMADHDSFFLDAGVQGKGIGTDLNEHSFKLYKKMGLERVETLANGDVGKYAWALQGFDYKNPKMLGAVKAGLPAWAKTELGIQFEMDALAAVSNMKHSWDVARFTVGGLKVGKEYMLSHGDWHGVLDLMGKGTEVFQAYAQASKAKKGK